MKIKVKKLAAIIPDLHYAKHGDAGFDIYAREETVLMPGKHAVIPTGVSMEIPEGYVGLIWDKSGLSAKAGLMTFGGVIDSGYRGEIHAIMINTTDTPYTLEAGHKVAQVVIQKFEEAQFEETDELSDSERGATGFGSSGK
jgi:dUTP pyrophosphatase